MAIDITSSIIGKRYLLQEHLGHGGMGAVYRALDRLTGEDVALKRVYVPPSEPDQENEAALNRLALAQEFRIMASMRHPNITSVLDYGFDDERQPYFTMELLKNPQSLSRAAWKSDTYNTYLLIQVLHVFAYLHGRGFLHRVLKPVY